MGDDNDTPCDKCKKSHRKPVCGPNGVTYDNICAAKNCAEFDPLEVIPGPCSIQNPCDSAPCHKGLKCVPLRKACGARRGCKPEQYRICVNKTKLACPVDVSDEQKICGTDNRTYESLCRMILEADDVNVWFDGPCNRSDCHGSVCGTDGVTYPNKCVLHNISPNVRIDYKGTCLEPHVNETVELFCKRVQQGNHCKIPTDCKKVIKPTDGCCSICGGAISIALDEDGLAQYADLRGTGEITRHMLVETLTANILKNNGSMKLLEKCKMESYVTSTGNLEIIFKAKNASHEKECFGGAENLSSSINNQGDETVVTTADDPVISFLTAGSVLEAEVSPVVAETENKAEGHLPPFILVNVLAITAATAVMI